MAVEYCDADELVIRASLPGLRPDRDIEVFIAGDVLHIRAMCDDGSDVSGSDLRYGSFVRDIALPANTDERDVSASYGEGTLEVRAPMGPGKVTTRSVPVTVIEGAVPPGS